MALATFCSKISAFEEADRRQNIVSTALGGRKDTSLGRAKRTLIPRLGFSRSLTEFAPELVRPRL